MICVINLIGKRALPNPGAFRGLEGRVAIKETGSAIPGNVSNPSGLIFSLNSLVRGKRGCNRLAPLFNSSNVIEFPPVLMGLYDGIYVSGVCLFSTNQLLNEFLEDKFNHQRIDYIVSIFGQT